MHSKKITEIALKRKLLETAGKTPAATMNALLILECRKENSRFKKAGPSRFALNPKYKPKKETKKSKRETAISEEFVKRAIIQWLSRNGWGYFHFGEPYSRGPDIRARKGGRVIFIETKGESSSHSGNEVRFIYGLGQLVTRMKVVDAPRAFNYAIGLPTAVAKIALRRIPWKWAKKLTVDVLAVSESNKVQRYTWKDLKENQAKS